MCYFSSCNSSSLCIDCFYTINIIPVVRSSSKVIASHVRHSERGSAISDCLVANTT